ARPGRQDPRRHRQGRPRPLTRGTPVTPRMSPLPLFPSSPPSTANPRVSFSPSLPLQFQISNPPSPLSSPRPQGGGLGADSSSPPHPSTPPHEPASSPPRRSIDSTGTGRGDADDGARGFR